MSGHWEWNIINHELGYLFHWGDGKKTDIKPVVPSFFVDGQGVVWVKLYAPEDLPLKDLELQAEIVAFEPFEAGFYTVTKVLVKLEGAEAELEVPEHRILQPKWRFVKKVWSTARILGYLVVALVSNVVGIIATPHATPWTVFLLNIALLVLYALFVGFKKDSPILKP